MVSPFSPASRGYSVSWTMISVDSKLDEVTTVNYSTSSISTSVVQEAQGGLYKDCLNFYRCLKIINTFYRRLEYIGASLLIVNIIDSVYEGCSDRIQTTHNPNGIISALIDRYGLEFDKNNVKTSAVTLHAALPRTYRTLDDAGMVMSSQGIIEFSHQDLTSSYKKPWPYPITHIGPRVSWRVRVSIAYITR